VLQLLLLLPARPPAGDQHLLLLLQLLARPHQPLQRLLLLARQAAGRLLPPSRASCLCV
jgi:hypothetical protein